MSKQLHCSEQAHQGNAVVVEERSRKMTVLIHNNIFNIYKVFHSPFSSNPAHLRCSCVVFIESVIFSAFFLELGIIFM